MKLLTTTHSLLLLGCVLLGVAPTSLAQYSNGQNASTVLGQGSFITTTPATTQSSFTGPQAVVSDPATGKVFVVDTGNNRILRFSSAAARASGTVAELVLGQTDFTTATPPPATPTDAIFNAPLGATIDSKGNLWVADTGYNRVLCFDNAAFIATNGASASSVLGQPGFVTATAQTTQIGMRAPSSVALDTNGTLYVLDQTNNRVLRFNAAASAVNGAPANGILGQANFLSSVNPSPPTASSLNAAQGLAVDLSNNLWVADTANNRVLRFDSPASKANGANANAVVGQTSFITNTSGLTQSKFSASGAIAITFDPLGRLYVTDTVGNRVLVFQNPSAITTGGTASFVLGQSTFTTGTAATPPTAASLNAPGGLSFDFTNNYLWVADKSNNRTLTFALVGSTPQVNSPSKVTLPLGKTKTFKFTVTNAGAASDVFRLQAIIPSNKSKKFKVFQLLYNGTNVLSSLQAGTFETPQLLAGQSVVIVVKMTPRSTAKGTFTPSLIAASETDPSSTSVSATPVTFKK